MSGLLNFWEDDMMKDTFFSTLAAVGAGIASSLLGGWDTALEILLIFMVLDYLTGMASAVKHKALKSSVGYEGLLKKGTVFLMVILAAQLDRIVGNGVGLFRTMTAMFFTANEGLSVLENVGELGVKLPRFISRTLEKLRDDNDPEDDASI